MTSPWSHCCPGSACERLQRAQAMQLCVNKPPQDDKCLQSLRELTFWLTFLSAKRCPNSAYDIDAHAITQQPAAE
jgi:hypothetical protein